jgi:uncharacterized protein YjbJ (UPF0337 family)
MANEPEVIRQEMAETRTALTEKLEALENHVLGTVESATCAVQETVGTVKDAVEGTVCTVKESIDATAETVKETFDLELQTRRHPVAMVAAATTAGLVTGLAYHRLAGAADRPPARSRPAADLGDRRLSAESSLLEQARQSGRSVLSGFEPELDKVKGMALGALFNIARDLVRPYVPRNLQPQFAELVDNVTRKAGGNPVQGSVMEEWGSTRYRQGERASG